MKGEHGGRDDGRPTSTADLPASMAEPSWSDRLTKELHDGVVMHVDGHGQKWPSALDALWTGRLRMPDDPLVHGQTDALRLAMEDVEAGRAEGAAIFGRGLAAIIAWLTFEGLATDEVTPKLTEEGAAVLVLLRASSAA